jgi:hypothetical protein
MTRKDYDMRKITIDENAPAIPTRGRVAPAVYEDLDAPAVSNTRAEPTASRSNRLSPAERASIRAKEIGASYREAFSVEDAFLIPEDIIPDGWAYQWKRFSTLGQEDPANISKALRAGWSFVDPADHPNDFVGFHDGGRILRDGQVLMMIPKVVEDKMRSMALGEARGAVDSKRRAIGEAVMDGFELDKKELLTGAAEYGTIPRD